MPKSRWSRLVTATVLGAVVAGCGPTEPELRVEIDTQTAMADYATLDAVLASPGFQAFQALGGRTPFGGGPTGIEVLSGMEPLGDGDAGRRFAVELVHRVQAANATRPAAAPIISDERRGSTFVYDPETDDYALDPDRTGAPETGVRFVLYAVDSEGKPIVEQETGYADLIDEGDESAQDIALHLVVVHQDEIALDYRTTLDENENRGALTVRGFLSGEGVRLDFDIEAVSADNNGTKTLDVAFDIGVDARDFSITGNVRGVEGEEGEGDIDVTVRHGPQSIRIDFRGSAGTLEGTVFVNGDIFATVSGGSDGPIFLGQGGDPLTAEEMLVLHRIMDMVEDVFDFLEDLLDPVDDIVILGIVL